MSEKFKVIVVGEMFTKGIPVLHYIKIEDDINDHLIKFHACDMNVNMLNLKEFLQNKPSDYFDIIGDTLEECRENQYKYLLRKLERQSFNVGSCGEGSFTYEIIEMTQEEFENPTGELMSPYAYEFLEKDEKAERQKYPFYHPITKELIFQIQ